MMAEVAPALLELAVAYARRGWRVFPLAGKIPAERGGRGCLDATTDESVIRQWWECHPHANVGIATGESSGLLAVDLDGPDARRAWLSLVGRHDPIETPTSRTGRADGGLHVLFRWPAGEHVPNRSQGEWSARVLGDRKIEVIGEGRYIVAPGSLHASGARYAWEHGSGERELAALPEWLVSLLREELPAARAEAPTWVPRTERDASRARAFCLGALRSGHDAVAGLPRGQRNAGLVREAYALGGYVPTGFLEAHEVRTALRSACAHWPADERDLRKDIATIERGLYAGMSMPRGIPDPRPFDVEAPISETRALGPTPEEVVPLGPPPPTWLEEAWKPLGEVGADWLDVEPPPQRHLLMRDGKPVCPAGIVGLLIAPGGRGKSMALLELAICIATGRPWLDAFAIAHPGPVAIILAEEPTDEVRRRLYRLAKAMELSPLERRLVMERVIALGLKGRDVALTESVSDDRIRATPLHAELVQIVERSQCDLIIDPLVRFAPGVESNNAQANKAVLLLEQLTQSSGRTIMVAHHTDKTARRNGSTGDASDARGVTGLTDSARWVGAISGVTENDLKFRVTKVNGVPMTEPVDLTRDPSSGRLRAPSSLDRDLAKARAAAMSDARRREVAEAILAAVHATPGIGKRGLHTAFTEAGGRVSRDLFDVVIDELVDENRLLRNVHGQRHCFSLPEGV